MGQLNSIVTSKIQFVKSNKDILIIGARLKYALLLFRYHIQNGYKDIIIIILNLNETNLNLNFKHKLQNYHQAQTQRTTSKVQRQKQDCVRMCDSMCDFFVTTIIFNTFLSPFL